MGRWKKSPWHKLSLMEKVILIAGSILMIGCLFLWEFTDSLLAMWIGVIVGCVVAYVVIKAAIKELNK